MVGIASDALAMRRKLAVSPIVLGVVVGLLADVRRRGRRPPTLIATLVALTGGLQLLYTTLPGEYHEGLLRSLTPDAFGPFARAAGAFLGLALLFAARGLARRRR